MNVLFHTRKGKQLIGIIAVIVSIPIVFMMVYFGTNAFYDVSEEDQTLPTINYTAKEKETIMEQTKKLYSGLFHQDEAKSEAEANTDNGEAITDSVTATASDAVVYTPTETDPVINGSDKPAIVARHLKGMGYCTEEIAGIMGNLDVEAPGFNEAARSSTGKYKGIVQWNPDRISAINAALGCDVTDGSNDFDEQLRGIAWEIPAKYGSAGPGSLIKFSDSESGSGNAKSCADGWCQIVEKCPGTYGNYATINGRNYQGLGDRRDKAESYYQQLTSGGL